jgi:hypothetical protein
MKKSTIVRMNGSVVSAIIATAFLALVFFLSYLHWFA